MGYRLCRSCKKDVRNILRNDEFGMGAASVSTMIATRKAMSNTEKWQCQICGNKKEGFVQKIITDVLAAIFALVMIAVLIIAAGVAYWYLY